MLGSLVGTFLLSVYGLLQRSPLCCGEQRPVFLISALGRKEPVAEHQESACLASSVKHSAIIDFPLEIFNIIAILLCKV